MNKQTARLWIASALIAGLVLGAVWHWMHVFPFPQLSAWKYKLGKQPALVKPPGRWKQAPTPDGLSEQQRREIQRLEAIGYLSGSQMATDRSNVTVHEETLAFEGLNLIVSGHATEAILTDMDGQPIHTWHCEARRAWPDLASGQVQHGSRNYWRRVHLLPGGHVLAIFQGIGLIKLDQDSNLLWGVRNGAHHDLDVDPEGNIYLLTRKAHVNPEVHAENPILEDYITILDPDGNLLEEIPILPLLRNSPYAPILGRLADAGDILHTNTIEILGNRPTDGPSPFQPHQILLSIRQLDLVCVADLERETISWAESDVWHRQHQPTLLPNGHLLVFDNRTGPNASSVVEFDSFRRKVTWAYRGNEQHPFYSESCGSCQRLPNGNTLVTESDPGRAFEVTPDKNIVWEYMNPHRAGEANQLAATLFAVIRLPPDTPLDWLP